MYSVKTSIYQSEQIREFENAAKTRFHLSETALMERAGKAAFDFLLRRWPSARRITVLCGNGNNGGDGYVLALLLHQHGMKVTLWQIGDHDHLREEAKSALNACQNAKVPIEIYHEQADLHHADVIVDAICGIGLKDHLRENIIAIIKKIERLQIPILAIDVPTGINADTGEILGAALHATVTITFIGLKLGLLTGAGIAYAGELVCNDLQLPSDLFTEIAPIAKKILLSSYAAYLKPRPRDWHKGLSGRVLIIGGDYGFSGAPRMAALAALRVGAGLVSVATHPEHALVMNAACPEIMCHGVSDAHALEPLLDKADVLVIGPGLGQTDWSQQLWAAALKNDMPKVVDADALNLLAKHDQLNDHWILTPHPGEAGRLLNETTEVVQQNRLHSIQAINKRYGGVCVLKGAGSLISESNSLPALCDKGNPGMASAGMGDILSGVIGGLIAQKLPLATAAELGVLMHARAGDLVAKDGERGMIATDLLPYLRHLANYE